MTAHSMSMLRPGVLALLAGLSAPAWPAASVLYNPAGGSLPAAQGWTVLAQGSAAAQALDAGAFRLDSTGPGVAIFGHGRISPQALDTQTGFDLSFQLQMLAESHTSPHRAGYSLLLVGAQASRALELGFWTDHVWAQRYDASQADRFVHDTDAALDTTAALTAYTLSVRQQQFTLRAGSNLLLTGALRDYTPAGFPYSTPNFLFLGDNSSRGQAISRLGLVSLSPVPEPAAGLLMALGLALGLAMSAVLGQALPARRRR